MTENPSSRVKSPFLKFSQIVDAWMKIGIVSSIKVMNIFIKMLVITTYDTLFMYSEHTGSIFIFLNRPLQESPMFEFVIIPIIFFSEFWIF